MLRTLFPVALSLLAPQPVAAQEPVASDAHQIAWQRTFGDAVALARAEGRPLLVALNMDGESASDRIVQELYRDADFVAATRACVCLVASVFRHSARDYDDEGRRIPCPRLGSVTCGEHIALEPALFDAFLADGERVAPRHALVLQDGSKAWDLSLCFDLRDIERALVDALGAGPQAPPTTYDERTWAALAARRDAAGRTALEDALARARDPKSVSEALAAIARHGDEGALDALALLAAAVPRLSPALRGELVECARGRGLAAPLAALLRARLSGLGSAPRDLGGAWRDAELEVVARLDGASAATRTLVSACRAVADGGGDRGAAACFGAEAEAVERAVAEAGGPVALRALVQLASRATAEAPAGALPRASSLGDALPPEDELERELAALDARIKAAPQDPELAARFGKALLDLARRRTERRESGTQLLFEDAEQNLARALAATPERWELWIERARAAWFLQRFEDERAFGVRALALAGLARLPDEGALCAELSASRDGANGGRSPLEDERVVEALRWIGDAHARLLGARAGGDPAAEVTGLVEGLRALGLVAASPFADAQDWTSFATFAGAAGLAQEELALALAGARRFPLAAELRQSLNDLLWTTGWTERAPELADRLLSESAPAPEAAWYSGYAWILAAEDARRREDPERAIARYDVASARFAAGLAAGPEDDRSYRTFLALTHLGRGMAQARAGRQALAADELVLALAVGTPLADARDGLGCDALDLVDKTLEWTESGASPVDPLALLERLQPLAPDDPTWALAISDSELREALRADGRNPERAERETVDASFRPIRIPIGLPTEEGDRYLAASIDAARRAPWPAGAAPDPRPLAQAATIRAERLLERGRRDGVREALAAAAPYLGAEPPPADASAEELRAFAARLRTALGPARPRERPGR